MADVVLNSLGVNTWENSFSCTGVNGRWVAFGGLTGADVKLNVQSLYRKQIKTNRLDWCHKKRVQRGY